MTSPRHRFSAHQGNPLLGRQLDQFFQALLKFRRLHVIGKPAKRGISPAHIQRIALRVTQTAESRQVTYPKPAFFSARGNEALLNCGLCRERGTVRTSTTRDTPCACSRRMNSSRVRVECPSVRMMGEDSA